MICKCDPESFGDRCCSVITQYSLGYRRKMVYITIPYLTRCYRVEEKHGCFYYPYFTPSGLCVKINNQEAITLVRGKEMETYQLGTLKNAFPFFRELADRYNSFQCIVGNTSILKTNHSKYIYKWDCSHPCSVNELYSFEKTNIGLYSSKTRHTIIEQASILDVCGHIYDLSPREYFIFNFNKNGEVVFTREEVRRYKTTGHL